MNVRADALSMHEPVLVNLLGHSAGALVFGIFIVLLWRGSGQARSGRLTRAAALAAFIWNAGAFVLLAWPNAPQWGLQVLTVVLASVLSLLPALLLDLSLDGRSRVLTRAGYALSVLAIMMHAAEFWVALPSSMHRITLILTAVGFGVLTVAGASITLRRSAEPLTRRAVAAMSLILFSLTFAHFQEQDAHAAWQAELIIHHAGIPLSLFILLQDYRFVLLDAFLRFLTNIILAIGFTFVAWRAGTALGWIAADVRSNPREVAVIVIAACTVLIVYALARSYAQRLLTHAVFRRPSDETTLAEIRTRSIDSDETFLAWAATRIARHFGADSGTWAPGEVIGAIPQGDGAAVGVRSVYVISIGRRSGGRRYLSEDLDALGRLAAAVGERLDRFHESEMKRLVSQAELRALQAQIHPHFLFNALNTLYGIIPKSAEGARMTVLNLADIFRYFLRTDRGLIPLREEIHIVHAYLEIEQLRLGPKLMSEIAIDDEAQSWPIPVLAVEPLVENAVKHGVSSLEQGGTVRVQARVADGRLRVTVTDTGRGFQSAANGNTQGVGLKNVRERLRLHFGDEGQIDVQTGGHGTVVELVIPQLARAGQAQ